MDKLGTVLNKMGKFAKDIGNYDTRKLGRTECKNGIIVSTVYTSDEGYESALIDKNGVHPVERYSSQAEAILGHKKWVKFAGEGVGKTIIKLGWSGMNMDEEIILEGG